MDYWVLWPSTPRRFKGLFSALKPFYHCVAEQRRSPWRRPCLRARSLPRLWRPSAPGWRGRGVACFQLTRPWRVSSPLPQRPHCSLCQAPRPWSLSSNPQEIHISAVSSATAGLQHHWSCFLSWPGSHHSAQTYAWIRLAGVKVNWNDPEQPCGSFSWPVVISDRQFNTYYYKLS